MNRHARQPALWEADFISLASTQRLLVAVGQPDEKDGFMGSVSPQPAVVDDIPGGHVVAELSDDASHRPAISTRIWLAPTRMLIAPC